MNANRYDKRITVTKEGRVEPWGSAPRITFPPAPMRPKIERPARPPIEAPKNPDKYVRRVVGIVGRSADAYEAGLALYNKYGKRSVLMERPLGSWMPSRSSDGSRIDGNVKVQLVGEGRNGKLGNRDAQDLARDVAAFHAMYGGKIAKVGLVSCNSNDCDATGKSLVDKVTTELHQLGIDTSVVGRNGAVQVNRYGRKREVPEGTPGSLGPSASTLSLRDLQRIADTAGDNLYRDAGGQSWSVKAANNDADFANNEILAGRLLSLAGVPVPEVRLVELGEELGGGIGIASRAIPGAQPVDVHADGDALAIARADFVAHAYIGKLDAFGIAGGTYVRDPSGAMVSIDHAASLRYGRSGKPRGDKFGADVNELEDMRTNFGMTLGILRDMSAKEFRAGLQRVVGIPDAAILSVVAEFGPSDVAEREALGRVLLKRKAHLADTLGRLDPDLTSGGLPESLAPKLTDRERAILGHLDELDDFFFLGDDEAPVTKFSFRGDKRPPGQIFPGGFPPWVKWPARAHDLAQHQVNVDRKHANLVSLSKVPSVSTDFARLVSGNHLYVMYGQLGLDMNRRLGTKSKYPEQREIAVPDGVAPEMILGAFDVAKDGILPGSFQPNPRFEIAMDREGFATRQRSLLDRHALFSSALDDMYDQWPWEREPGAEAQLRHDRAKVEWKLQGLYREQEAAARRDANRREFTDTTLKE